MTAAKKTGKPAAAKKRGLGRGLEALLGPSAAAATPPLEAQPGDTLKRLPVKQLQPGKYQPRRTMDDDKLKELAGDICKSINIEMDGQGRYWLIERPVAHKFYREEK